MTVELGARGCVLALVAVLAGGCGSEGPSDWELYTQALTERWPDSVATCSQIAEAELQGECRAGVAAGVARKNIERAEQTCEGIEHPVWRDECYFLAADKAELVGRPALETCAKAGRFAERCTQHAAHRDLASRPRSLAVGQEVALWKQTRDVVASYHPGRSADDLVMMVNAGVAQQIADRWDPEPFNPASCGDAGDEICAMAYETHLFEASEEGRLAAACASDRTGEAVSAAGVLGWVGESKLARAVLDRACETGLGRGKAAQHSGGGPPAP